LKDYRKARQTREIRFTGLKIMNEELLQVGKLQNTHHGQEISAWEERQQFLSEVNDLSILLVEGEQPPELTKTNNNSICQEFQSSPIYEPRCHQYCGKAFENAINTGKTIKYTCHAGLTCTAVPVQINKAKNLAIIVGRTFIKSADYRLFMDRLAQGEWADVPEDNLPDNILLDFGANKLKKLTTNLAKLSPEELKALIDFAENYFSKKHTEALNKALEEFQLQQSTEEINVVSDSSQEVKTEKETETEELELETPQEKEPEKTEEPQTVNNETEAEPEIKEPETETKEIIEETPVVDENQTETPAEITEAPITKEFTENKLSSVAEAETSTKEIKVITKEIHDFEETAAYKKLVGAFFSRNFRDACSLALQFLTDKLHLNSLVWLERRNSHLETYHITGRFKGQKMRVRIDADDPRLRQAWQDDTSVEMQERQSAVEAAGGQIVELFPVAVSGELKSALLIGDSIADDEQRKKIIRFCRRIALPLEVVRLREELRQRARLSSAVQRFNNSLKTFKTNNLIVNITIAIAEILQAGRSSFLLYDEANDRFKVEAAIGKFGEPIEKLETGVGERIAREVWKKGKPLVIEQIGLVVPPSPDEYGYKSPSFISYPIFVGGRKIGVLNLTEKIDGGVFDENDLDLLNVISPQITVMLDNAKLQQKAGHLEEMTVTDPLTGLKNRRYLDARLLEEVNRSDRHGYPMCFLMIDIDNFGAYNKDIGVQAGDEALKLTAKSLQSTLRGEDVAVRYGGEEFCIMLPQTTLNEGVAIAERVRRRVENAPFAHRQITISVGVASFGEDLKTPEDIIAAADQAMRNAKKSGKNNVQVYNEN
jgi:diguanylate cyclase (GGDEF)-like protein